MRYSSTQEAIDAHIAHELGLIPAGIKEVVQERWRSVRKAIEESEKMLKDLDPDGIGVWPPENEEEPMKPWYHHREEIHTSEEVDLALDFWGGDVRWAPKWFTKYGPKIDPLSPLKVPCANFLWKGRSVEPVEMRNALDFWAGDQGLYDAKFPSWYWIEVKKQRRLKEARDHPKMKSSIMCPEGVAVLLDIDGEVGSVELRHNYFVLSKRQLRWKKMKAVLLWAAVAGGCTLGWNYGGGVFDWWAQRKAAIVAAEKYEDSHYRVGWVCGNCKNSSLPHGEGILHLDVIKGQPADLLGIACPRCMVIGRLIPQ